MRTVAPHVTQPDPLTVLRATAAVMQVRGGHFQPVTRQHEPEPPTAYVVRDYLSGYPLHSYGITRAAIDQAYAAQADTASAAYMWCADTASATTPYRAKLAKTVRRPAVGPEDLPLICSAVKAWRAERARCMHEADRRTEADRSRHQGAKGDRLRLEATVTYVKTLPSRQYGYHEQPRYLLTFRDDDWHVYVWEAHTHQVPAKGARVALSGTVRKHTLYRNRMTGQETAQTELTRCRWTLLQAV